MLRTLILSLVLMSINLHAWEPLSEKYCVSFGNEAAPCKIIEYFSFACPHCVALFRKDFSNVKEKLINQNKVSWTFHPVPVDIQTVQAMICLENLSPPEKRLFLEVLLEEAEMEDPDITSQLMKRAMEILKKPLPLLQQKDFISDQPAFQSAFLFLKQEDIVKTIPSVKINGKFFAEEVPECSFVEKYLEATRE
ncbi:MAG: hypothetical protein CK425_11200 [Parachlamydia sp.]|nr:MAG: hypothetical protein CK425_11200 [Parachlamydia sp.]